MFGSIKPVFLHQTNNRDVKDILQSSFNTGGTIKILNMTSPHPNISKGFYQSLSKLRENHEFEDFKVKVDEDVFACHSLILASCSEFFRCLLRTDMKEKQEMLVELTNISSTIFKLILDSLYTGCELLTKENVLEVWSAVHQLQIQFLIEHCEDFVIEYLSLDTIGIYKEHAERLQSEKVSEHIFNFILKHFGKLRENEIFLQLDFQYLIRLLESDKLEVSSEDLVLFTIFKWVNYTHLLTKKLDASNESQDDILDTINGTVSTEITEEPDKENSSLKENINWEEKQIDLKNQEEKNERKQFIIPLLKSSRYFLSSEACIVKLFSDKLIQNDISVKNILFEAFAFKFCEHVHNYCPNTAIHRDCSNIEHVGLYFDGGILSALSLKKDNWFSMPNLIRVAVCKLTVFKGKLYACSVAYEHKEVCVHQKNSWEPVTFLPQPVQLLLTHENKIYAFHSDQKDITSFNPETCPLNLETSKHEINKMTFAISFHNTIVVFSSVDNNGVEETAVHSWNTETNVWKQLDNLEFSSQNMTSFRDDVNTYILDSNGNLWKLKNPEIIEFTFVTKLWSTKYNLKGAILFRKKLFIFGGNPRDLIVLEKVEGVYNSRRVWGTDRKTSNFIHHVIPACELTKT